MESGRHLKGFSFGGVQKGFGSFGGGVNWGLGGRRVGRDSTAVGGLEKVVGPFGLGARRALRGFEGQEELQGISVVVQVGLEGFLGGLMGAVGFFEGARGGLGSFRGLTEGLRGIESF